MTAALTGGVVTNAVNIAAVRPEAMEALAPFVPLCEKLGRLAQGLGDGSVDRVSAEFRGRIASHDTRLLGIAVLVGILSGNTEEPVNLVNAPQMAEERGIELVETKDASAEDFTELVTVRVALRRRRGRGRRDQRRPAQRALPRLGLGRGLLPALRRPHRGLPLRRPAGDDRPGRDDVRRGGGQHRLRRGRRRAAAASSAVMALTTDAPVRAGDDREDPRARRLLASAARSTSSRTSGSRRLRRCGRSY